MTHTTVVSGRGAVLRCAGCTGRSSAAVSAAAGRPCCTACTFLLSSFSHLAFLSPRSHATIAMRLHSASSLPSPAFSLRPSVASLRQPGRAFRGPTAHLRCQTSGWGRQCLVGRLPSRRCGECPCAPPRSPSLKLIAPLSRGAPRCGVCGLGQQLAPRGAPPHCPILYGL